MAGKYDWYVDADVTKTSESSTSITYKINCYFVNNGYNYSMYMYGWVTYNGTEYSVMSRKNVDTTSLPLYGGRKLLGSKSVTITKTQNQRSIPYSARVKSDGGFADGNKSSSTKNLTVPALASYAVTYNANGGSGAPSSQTKWYGTNLTLSSTEPIRSGYLFLGWSNSSSATTASVQPGSTYSTNESVTYYAVWKLNEYAVTYNANGGSGAPSSQTKINGTNLTLSSIKPTRTGYTFVKWNTKSDGSGTDYNPEAIYSTNEELKLYAIWQINTWSVTYNANGGSGAPSSQTKTYGIDLTLSSTIPTRSKYNFLGWSTSSSGSVIYRPGSVYSVNYATTLYAIWELAYYSPSLSINSCYRIDNDGNASDDGDNAQVTFTYSADINVYEENVIEFAIVSIKLSDSDNWVSDTITLNRQSGSYIYNSFKTLLDAPISTEYQYDIKVEIKDTMGPSQSNTTIVINYISSAFFTIDFLAGGHGIAFGQPSSEEGFVNNMDSTFNKPTTFNDPIILEKDLKTDSSSGTIGQILTSRGNNLSPVWIDDPLFYPTDIIPAGSDFDDLTTAGSYYITDNASLQTMLNGPYSSIYGINTASFVRVYRMGSNVISQVVTSRTGRTATRSSVDTGATWGSWLYSFGKVTLNGSNVGDMSIYAPTTAGTSGQILMSNGSAAPIWTNTQAAIPTVRKQGSWTITEYPNGYTVQEGSVTKTGMNLTTSSQGTYYSSSSGYVTATLPVALSEVTGIQALEKNSGHSSGVYAYEAGVSTGNTSTLTVDFRAHASLSGAVCTAYVRVSGWK